MTSSQIFRLRCLLLVFASYSTVIILLYSYYPPNPDQAIYDQMGEVIARGGVIYRDCADMNFPGEPLIHALALKVFGDPLRSYRLLDGVLLIAFTAIVALELAARGRPGTGTAFLFVYPLMYITSGTWFAGQRDILAAHAGLLAGLCLVRTEPAGRVRPLVAGLLLFAAVLIKPTYLLFAPGLLLVDLVANRGWKGGLARVASRHAAAWVTLIAAVLLFAALARHARVLDDWYDFTIRFNTQVYAKDSPALIFIYCLRLIYTWLALVHTLRHTRLRAPCSRRRPCVAVDVGRDLRHHARLGGRPEEGIRLSLRGLPHRTRHPGRRDSSSCRMLGVHSRDEMDAASGRARPDRGRRGGIYI